MRLSGASWSFVGTSLSEAVAIYHTLGIEAVDLIAIPGDTLASEDIIADPVGQARQISRLGVPIANLLFNYSPNFSDRALNHRNPRIRRQNSEEFHAVAEFCRLCSIPSVTVLPGVMQEGWSPERCLAVSAEALNELAGTATGQGVQLTFEAHVGSILESPLHTLEFLEANPSLQLTLDYSHFVFNGYAREYIDPLAAFCGHVHLRQGAPKVLQARWDQGTIDFPGVISNLQAAGYRGYLGLEYEHDSWLDLDRVDVMTETIKMRNLVLPLIATPEGRGSQPIGGSLAHGQSNRAIG